MVRGIGKTKIRKKRKGFTEDKDYITEAYLQGSKAVGRMLKKKKTKKK